MINQTKNHKPQTLTPFTVLSVSNRPQELGADPFGLGWMQILDLPPSPASQINDVIGAITRPNTAVQKFCAPRAFLRNSP
jgi:hypothetical protein